MAFLQEWNFSADGNGEWFILTHRIPFELQAVGTFGGGTITFQSSPAATSNAQTYNVTGVSLTANGTSGPLGGVPGDQVRPVLTGATAPTVTVYLAETVARA